MIGLKPILAICFFCAVLGVALLCVFVFPDRPSEECVRTNRSFEYTVAEGVRTWNSETGVNSVCFDACRIEKMKLGVIYLGMFDVLCLDGLVLNLPLPSEAGSEERGGERKQKAESSFERRAGSEAGGAVEALAGLLPQTFLKCLGVPIANLAGISIKGFQVNKVENQHEVPVFAADRARNYREMLKLKNCRVFESGRTNSVGVAYLTLQPSPALVWKDGVRKLDDLFPNYTEMKGKE